MVVMADVLAELRARRDHECRLTPDRALQTIDEAVAFLRNRGLLTRTPASSLPSLYEACHEEPYRAGAQGFGSWPATKWPWAGQLAARDDIHALKIHYGKVILLTDETARLADPICRAELARMENAEPGWGRLLRYLADAGPSLIEDVQRELAMPPRELKALRYPLERCGALVGRQLVLPAAAGGHLHTTELARWDQVFPVPAPDAGGMADLVAAGVRAAVLAPEKELARWFSWRWRFTDGLIDSLTAAGRIIRPAAGFVAAPFVA